jgi:hypothetical protein
MDYKAQVGDIFLCDSDRTAAKMVKFLMQSPTVWQQLWRWMTKRLQPVRYYHAGMILSQEQMIEQQGKVQYGETKKILSRRITIFRKTGLTFQQAVDVGEAGKGDIGEGYGIISVIGKALTWITGLTLFEDLMHIGDADICVNRVAYWYWKSNGELFGVKNFRRTTTKTMDEYLMQKENGWEVVYTNG